MAYRFRITLYTLLHDLCLCVVLFIATKNADQPLAVWRMVQKFAFEQNGVAAQTTQNEAKILIYTSVILSATVLWLLGGNAA